MKYSDQIDERPTLVSVVIPVFNGERYICDAVESVLRQTYNNIEILVIDDGSTDETIDRLASYAHDITIIKQPNGGSAKARNAGIRQSKGELIAFLDADDLWHPQKLEILVSHMSRNTNIGLAYNSWQVINADDEIAIGQFMGQSFDEQSPAIVPEGSGFIYCELLIDSIIHTSAAIMRRSIVDAVGLFDERFRKGQDYEFWFRVSRVVSVHKLAADLSIYRLHPGGVTSSASPINYGPWIIGEALKKWGRVGPDGRKTGYLKLHRRLADQWHSFGMLHYGSGNFKVASASFLKSLIHRPWGIRTALMFAMATIKLVCEKVASLFQ